jgi:hypothetical protein
MGQICWIRNQRVEKEQSKNIQLWKVRFVHGEDYDTLAGELSLLSGALATTLNTFTTARIKALSITQSGQIYIMCVTYVTTAGTPSTMNFTVNVPMGESLFSLSEIIANRMTQRLKQAI